MTHTPVLRVLTIAALVASMAAGCARAPLGTQAGMPAVKRGSAIGAMAAPVSTDALSVARKWNEKAQQVSVAIVKSDEGDDVATYAFTAPGKSDAMLIVADSGAGFKSQEAPLSGTAATHIAKVLPLSSLETKLADSKVLFKAAEAAGLTAPTWLTVLHIKDQHDGQPAAMVSSNDGSYVVLDAATGKALSAVTRGGDRRVQLHEAAVVVVIVGAVGTALVWGAKKLIAKFWKPKPKPSPTPTPAPTTRPSEAPSEDPNPVLSAPPAP